MASPEQEIAACRKSHERLCAAVQDLAADDMTRPSRLPAWTVGHVLTHLARNADSVVRRLEGAVAGNVVQQYTGGRTGRARDIQDGAGRACSEIKADVVVSSRALDELFARFPCDAWDRPVLLGSGAEGPARDLAAARWREVEIHHVDLGLGYDLGNWDQAFIDRFLPGVVDSLPARADRAALLAWGLGRGMAPDLGPWG